jgi:acid phosphatase type 7
MTRLARERTLRRRFFRVLVVAAALVSCGGGGALVNPARIGATGDPVIAVAGDIACDPSNGSFNGGAGTTNACKQGATAQLVNSMNPAAVLPLGDNQYYCGGYNAFLGSYDQSWGSFKSITHPSVGNHEYLTSGGTDCNAGNAGAHGYFTYFGSAAGQQGSGYYSYDIGTWHLIALNSNCGDAAGCNASSPQGRWLAADLAAHQNTCTLAYWHIPLYSSGGRANGNSRPFWQMLYDNNADLILSAHDHTYERFAPQTPTGVVDPVRGIREFIVGSGGANHTSFVTTAANSEVRNATTFGVLRVTLHPTSYDWQFVPVQGQTFTDSGSTACHGASSDTQPPTAPSNLTGTAVNGGRVDLSWTASTDNVAVGGYRIFRNGTQIGSTPGTTYSDTTAIPGSSYQYYVVAFDTSNNVSQPSSTATVQTPPDTSAPTTPANLVATAPGATEVDLGWSASSDDVAVAGYRIFRDGVQVATSAGPSYADLTVQASTTYSYRVAAYDTAGNVSGQSNAATVTTPAAPTTLTFTPSADTWVEADTPTTNYGSNTVIGTDNSPVKRLLLKFNVSGIAGRQVQSARLRLRCADPSGLGGIFHRVADTSWTEGGVNWNNAPPGDSATLGQLGAVSTGNWYEVNVSQLVAGDGTFSLDATSTSSDGADYTSKEGAAGFAPQLVVTMASVPSDTTAPSVPTNLTASATGASHVDLSWTPSTDDVGVVGYKIYRNAVQIGSSTTASFADTTALPNMTYTYTVSAFDAAGNESGRSDPATATTPSDTTPPSAPTNVTATASGPSQVNLTWLASTDDVGVASYQIDRNGTAVGTSSSTSFTDTSVQPSTTYTYTVAALDAAGNRSANSNTATVTTGALATILTFTPTADSFVESDLPSSNFGTNTSLKVDGSPDQEALLKFTVSGVLGRTVTSAKLRLYCTNASGIGGDLRRVADTTWGEQTVTWANAPAADPTPFGLLGSVVVGSWVEVSIPFVTGDGTYSIHIKTTSADGSFYSSKEGTAGFAPQLVVNTS